MEKYNWSTSEIDNMDFFKTVDIIFDDVEASSNEPTEFIDQVFGT